MHARIQRVGMGVGCQDLPGKSRVAIVVIGNIGTDHPLEVIEPIVLQWQKAVS